MATYIDAMEGKHTDGSDQLSNPMEYRNGLIEAYVHRILDGMDMKDLVSYAAEKMTEDLESYSDEELRTEIMDYYPDLLENEND